MKAYLRNIAFFLLPVIVLLGITEVLLRRIPNDYSLKRDRMLHEGRSLDFLVLGNSHAYHGVDPALMGGRGFNAANISQDLRLDHELLKRYIGGMPHLEHLFITVSYGSLSARLETGREAWRMKNYTLYMDIAPSDLALGHHLELLNRPMRAQVDMVFDHLLRGKDNVLCTPSGASQGKAVRRVDLEAGGPEAARRHTRSSPEATAQGRALLEAIIALARQHGVKVHLFIPPAWISYRRALDQRQLNVVRSTCRKLAASHPHVTFDDLLDDPRFTEADFGDADHLAPSGTAKLSAILAGYIEQP